MLPISDSSRIAWSTHRLAGVAKGLASAGQGRIDSLCRQVLAVRSDGGNRFAGRSCLNNDGVPLQLCLSANAKGHSLRLIGDPGADLPDAEERYRASVAAVYAGLESSGSDSLTPWMDKTLAMLLPSTAAERSKYRDGFVWIAVSPEHAGLAVYIETAPLGRDGGWEAAERWLGEMLPTLGHAAPLLQHLKTNCEVASLGLEGSDPANTRAKIYFRFAVPTAVTALGIDLLASPEIVRFLETAMGSQGIDRDGLILSVGFSLATGALADVKADLCGHCLTYSDDEWIALADRCADANGIARLPLRDALATGDCGVALISLGLDVERKPRINLYLRARMRRDVPRRDELAVAARDAVHALAALQEASGRISDYDDLPVGASDQWVTAFVGLALAQAEQVLGDGVAHAAAERAADWLTRERTYEAGWGYNAITGPDADSTAMTLALLRALGRPIAPGDQCYMSESWRAEEGIATFLRHDAWGVAHWDVTPWGYLGLSAEEQSRLRGEFLKALEVNRLPNGMWRAYWWRTPLYSTFVTLEVLQALGLAEPDLPIEYGPLQIDNAFDLSCLIGIEQFRGVSNARVGDHLRAMLEWQDRDGRWPGHANLRVTEQSCYEPWNEPESGDYYKDDAGTITTAMALRVLSHRLRAEGS
jgi:hypothetical protein